MFQECFHPREHLKIEIQYYMPGWMLPGVWRTFTIYINYGVPVESFWIGKLTFLFPWTRNAGEMARPGRAFSSDVDPDILSSGVITLEVLCSPSTKENRRRTLETPSPDAQTRL